SCIRRIYHSAQLRLDDRKAHRERPVSRRGHHTNETRASRVCYRRREDHHTLPHQTYGQRDVPLRKVQHEIPGDVVRFQRTLSVEKPLTLQSHAPARRTRLPHTSGSAAPSEICITEPEVPGPGCRQESRCSTCCN